MSPGAIVEVLVGKINADGWIRGTVAHVIPPERTGDVERYVIVPDDQTCIIAGCRAESMRVVIATGQDA